MNKCLVEQCNTVVPIEGLEKIGEYRELVIPVVANALKRFTFAVDLNAGDTLGVLVEGTTLGSDVSSQNVRGVYSDGQTGDVLMQYKVGEFKTVNVAEDYKGVYIGLPSGLVTSSGNAKITLKVPFNSLNNKTLVSEYSKDLVSGTSTTIVIGNLTSGLYYVECTYDNTVTSVYNSLIDINVGSTYFNALDNPYGLFAFDENKTDVKFFIGSSKFTGSGNLKVKLYKVNDE